MKILCLVDFKIEPGDRWLWNYLPSNNDVVDFISASASDKNSMWGKLFTYYPAYWQLAYRAILQTRIKTYDFVVAWEAKNGFPFAILRYMFGINNPPLVILTFSYRGLIRHFTPLARVVMSSINHISVTTKFEQSYYHELLEFPIEKISFYPLGMYDSKLKLSNHKAIAQKFILSYGRSYRDYETFVKAIAGLDIQVKIIARKFNLKGIQIPNNVITMDLMPLMDFWRLLNTAQFVVVPLRKLPHTAGDSAIIMAMSAGKAVIATKGPSSDTYIENGITGLKVSPNNIEELQRAILLLWENPNMAQQMGQEGRKRYEAEYTFDAYARRVNENLAKVYNECYWEKDCS